MDKIDKVISAAWVALYLFYIAMAIKLILWTSHKVEIRIIGAPVVIFSVTGILYELTGRKSKKLRRITVGVIILLLIYLGTLYFIR